MIKLAKYYLFSSTSKDSLYLMVGTIISTLLNFLTVYLLTSKLSPESFGLFITALSFSLLLTDILALGIGASILNYVPNADADDKLAYIKASMVLRIFTYSILSLLIILFSTQISKFFFGNNDIQPFIFSSSIGIWLLAMVFTGQVILLSLGKYLQSSILNTSMNVFRLIVIFLLVFLGINDSSNLFLGYNLALIFSVFLIFIFIGHQFIKSRVKKYHFVNILKFGLPIGASFAVAAVYTRLDQIMVFNLAGEKEAGIYGLAFRIATIFIFLGDAFNQALVTRFVAYKGEHFRDYFRKVIVATLALTFLMGLTVPIDPYILPLIFGPNYHNSILTLQILTIGMIFFTLSTPFSTALIFRFKKNKFPFILSLASIVMIFILLNILIPLYQSSGAAIALMLVYLMQFIVSFFYFQINEKGQFDS